MCAYHAGARPSQKSEAGELGPTSKASSSRTPSWKGPPPAPPGLRWKGPPPAKPTAITPPPPKPTSILYAPFVSELNADAEQPELQVAREPDLDEDETESSVTHVSHVSTPTECPEEDLGEPTETCTGEDPGEPTETCTEEDPGKTLVFPDTTSDWQDVVFPDTANAWQGVEGEPEGFDPENVDEDEPEEPEPVYDLSDFPLIGDDDTSMEKDVLVCWVDAVTPSVYDKMTAEMPHEAYAEVTARIKNAAKMHGQVLTGSGLLWSQISTAAGAARIANRNHNQIICRGKYRLGVRVVSMAQWPDSMEVVQEIGAQSRQNTWQLARKDREYWRWYYESGIHKHGGPRHVKNQGWSSSSWWRAHQWHH